jgi:hypothetical protein
MIEAMRTLLLTALLSATLSHAQPSLTVEGIAGDPITITLAELATLPQQTIKVTDHGQPATFEGVALQDLLAKVERPAGEKFHKTVASYYLLVEAKDGYRAVYAWAEVDPSFMDKPVYLATKRDGKALTEKDGPFQLVAPGEKRGARWVHQVTALRIRKAN